MAKSKLFDANMKIEEKVVGAYKAIENGVVGTYKKVEDKFVDNFLTKDGETIEEAKERLSAEQQSRKEAAAAETEKRFKEILHAILFPPLWVVAIASLIGFPFVIFALSCLSETNSISYAAYILSAYAFTVLVIAFPKISYRIKNNPIVDKINSHPIGNQYLNDLTFKGCVSLHQGLLINLFYAGFKFVTSILYGSVWLGAIAVYYVMLCILRLNLIVNSRKTARLDNRRLKWEHNYRSYRRTGFLMFLLNAAMGGMIVQMT